MNRGCAYAPLRDHENASVSNHLRPVWRNESVGV